MKEDRFMPKFAFSFRAPKHRTLNQADEAAWGDWFGKIRVNIADFGNRAASVAASATTGPTLFLAATS
jgi:hypothetical protein